MPAIGIGPFWTLLVMFFHFQMWIQRQNIITLFVTVSKPNYALRQRLDGAKNACKNTCKNACKNTCTIFFASNCDKPLITKLVRRKILHETVVRARLNQLRRFGALSQFHAKFYVAQIF